MVAGASLAEDHEYSFFPVFPRHKQASFVWGQGPTKYLNQWS